LPSRRQDVLSRRRLISPHVQVMVLLARYHATTSIHFLAFPCNRQGHCPPTRRPRSLKQVISQPRVAASAASSRGGSFWAVHVSSFVAVHPTTAATATTTTTPTCSRNIFICSALRKWDLQSGTATTSLHLLALRDHARRAGHDGSRTRPLPE